MCQKIDMPHNVGGAYVDGNIFVTSGLMGNETIVKAGVNVLQDN